LATKKGRRKGAITLSKRGKTKGAITASVVPKTGRGSGQITIKVENFLPDNVPTFYSDAVTILHTANEFILSFLQTEFPLAASKEELEKIELLRRKCVTQVVVSPAQAEALIKALDENMKKYVAEYRNPEDYDEPEN